MFIVLFNLLILLYSQNKNDFIENELFSISYTLIEKEVTPKKNVYNIHFKLINKSDEPLYYVAKYEAKKESDQFKINNKINEAKDVVSGGNTGAPPPLTTSAYVNSGGASKIGSESARSSASNRAYSQDSKLNSNSLRMPQQVDYKLKNEIFSLNYDNFKNSKFFSEEIDYPNNSYFIQNNEDLRLGITFDNITESTIEDNKGSEDYNPVICIIPPGGLEKISVIEISNKKGIDPINFYLTFSKETVFANNIKIEIEKTFHKSIELASQKYFELQSILNQN